MNVMNSFYNAAKAAIINRQPKALTRIVDAAYKFLKEGQITEEKFVKFQGWVHKSQALIYRSTAKDVLILLTPPVVTKRGKPTPRESLTATLGELCPKLATLLR